MRPMFYYIHIGAEMTFNVWAFELNLDKEDMENWKTGYGENINV